MWGKIKVFFCSHRVYKVPDFDLLLTSKEFWAAHETMGPLYLMRRIHIQLWSNSIYLFLLIEVWSVPQDKASHIQTHATNLSETHKHTSSPQPPRTGRYLCWITARKATPRAPWRHKGNCPANTLSLLYQSLMKYDSKVMSYFWLLNCFRFL